MVLWFFWGFLGSVSLSVVCLCPFVQSYWVFVNFLQPPLAAFSRVLF